jgi:hypothetical protein
VAVAGATLVGTARCQTVTQQERCECYIYQKYAHLGALWQRRSLWLIGALCFVVAAAFGSQWAFGKPKTVYTAATVQCDDESTVVTAGIGVSPAFLQQEQQEEKQGYPGQQPGTPQAEPEQQQTPAKADVLVIGFVGGFIRHDDLVHSEVQLAARLRKAYPSGVDVETFESYREEKARKKVFSFLNTNHDRTLTPEEKRNARIIIYGHSWGGSEAITLARELEKDNIPVALTIQVDSVSKPYQVDTVIPANVVRAANFYQTNGHLHGHPIRAADPTRTHILGNFRFHYEASAYNCTKYPWYDRIFTKAHTQIECDPNVWKQVESLIRTEIGPK